MDAGTICLIILGALFFLFWLLGPAHITIWIDAVGSLILGGVALKTLNWGWAFLILIFLFHVIYLFSSEKRCPKCKKFFYFKRVGSELIEEGTPFTKYRKVRDENGYEHTEPYAVQNNVYIDHYRCKKCGYEDSYRVRRQKEA